MTVKRMSAIGRRKRGVTPQRNFTDRAKKMKNQAVLPTLIAKRRKNDVKLTKILPQHPPKGTRRYGIVEQFPTLQGKLIICSTQLPTYRICAEINVNNPATFSLAKKNMQINE